MDKDLADFSIRYLEKLGADYVEARLEQHEGSGFLLKNGNLEASGFNSILGLGIRFLINKTLGFVSINNLKKEITKNIIKDAINLTKKCSKLTEKTRFSDEKAVKDSYKVKSKFIEDDEKVKLLFDLEKEIKSKEVPGRFLNLSDDIMKKYFINSEGSKIEAEIPRIGFVYYLTTNIGNKTSQRYWQYGASSDYSIIKKWDLFKILKDEVKAMKNNLKFGKKMPAGKFDVVVGPQVTGIIVHESTGHPYEADRIFGREGAQAGESFITKKMIGTKIGSEVVNIIEDPTLEKSYGFYLYDDEGVKARKRFLIKNGIINEFLHNRETAFSMNLKSNGSARANNYDKEPIVRMSNTIMLPGNHDEEELIEDVKKGVYIKNFMEWNIDDKRYHQKYVGSESYLIEKGRLTKPVINPVIEISTPALYKSIDAVGKNMEYHAGNCGKGEPMQSIPVWFGGPSFRLRNIKFE